MARWQLMFGLLAVTGAAPSAVAQDRTANDQAVERLARCERREQRNLGRLESVGDAASSVTRRIGRFVGASERDVERVLRVGRSLSNAIASRLDCDEQEQAVAATEEAVQGGVGTTARWRSETRENVTGSSTVDAEERLANGESCLTVTDIVIVDGEETRAPKRMCRRPPSNRYVRV